MFRFLPALALLASPALAAPADPAQTTKALTEAERHWATYDAQATGCAFATATVDVIQRREIAMQRKLARIDQPGIKVPPAKMAAMPCKGPTQGELVGAVMVNTFDWLERLDLARTLEVQPGWSRGIARLGIYAPGSQAMLYSGIRDSLIKANSAEVINQRREALRKEVVSVLMLMCRERRPQATNCPPLPDALKGQEASARVRLAELERAASQLIGIEKLDEVSAVGQPWRLQTTPADNSSRCVKGDQVIFPHARETSRSVLPRQILVFLRPVDNLNITNNDDPDDLVTIEEQDGGYVLMYSPRLKVGFRDPVKRRFIPCDGY